MRLNKQSEHKRFWIDKGDALSVLQLPEGRRVLQEIFRVTNVEGASFVADDRATCLNEGVRSVGIWLKSEIENADKDAYYRLMLERRNNVSG